MVYPNSNFYAPSYRIYTPSPNYRAIGRSFGRRNAIPLMAAAGAGIAGLGKMAYNYMSAPKASASTKSSARGSYRMPRTMRPIKGKKTIKKQIKELKRVANASTGTLIYRDRRISRCLTTANVKNYILVPGNPDYSQLETVLGQLRFFNPSSPGTLVQGNGSTGTYFRKFHFKTIASKCKVSNNYQVPCQVTVMCATVKLDTNINPATAYQDGLADAGNPTATSNLVYWSDSPQFNELWKITKRTKRVLQPGKTLTVKHLLKDIMYDVSLSDSHNLTYQKDLKSFVWIVQVQGVQGHDTSADQQGTLPAGVDVQADYTYVVSYDAGIDLKFIYVTDSSTGFTNGGVVSEKPVADNIGYSVS